MAQQAVQQAAQQADTPQGAQAKVQAQRFAVEAQQAAQQVVNQSAPLGLCPVPAPLSPDQGRAFVHTRYVQASEDKGIRQFFLDRKAGVPG